MNKELRKTLLNDLQNFLAKHNFETEWDRALGGEPILAHQDWLWVSICRENTTYHVHLIPRTPLGEEEGIVIPLADPEYKKKTWEGIAAIAGERDVLGRLYLDFI